MMRLPASALALALLASAAQAQTVSPLPAAPPGSVFPKAGIDCDFVNQRYFNCQLDANFLITRASSGMAQDAQSGIWGTYGPGVWRISSRGFLIEESSINNALWARDLTQSGTWTATSITTALNATGIDGTANSATTLTATGANGTILQSITLASATDAYGLHVKRVTGSGNIQATLDNSTFTTLSSANCVDKTGAASNIVTTDFVWCTVSQAALTNPTIGIKIVTSGDVVIVDGNQLENLGVTYATSPIFTTTTTQARATDNVVTAGLFNALFGRATGTILVVGGGTLNSANTPRILARSSTNYIGIPSTTVCRFVVNNTSASATLGSSGSTTGETRCVAAWGGSASADNTAIAANGGTVATSAQLLGGGAAVSYQVGSVGAATNFYDGYIKRLAIAPAAAFVGSLSGSSR